METVHSRALSPIIDLPSGERVAFAHHTAQVTPKVANELREHLEVPAVADLGLTFASDDDADPDVKAALEHEAQIREDAERLKAERAAAEANAREVDDLRAHIERLEHERQVDVQREVERRVAEMRELQAAQQTAAEPDPRDLDPLARVVEPEPDATIEAILKFVGEDKERAAARLEIEKGRGNDARSTLVEKLTALAG